MTFITDRNSEFYWARLSSTQQEMLTTAYDGGGGLPLAGYTVATVRRLQREGYADGGHLTTDGFLLVTHIRIRGARRVLTAARQLTGGVS